MIPIADVNNGMMKKKLAFSIAVFILNDVEADSKESYVSMYMRWKKKRNIILHHPQNARYALKKFEELGHLTEKERNALMATVRCESQYLSKNL